MSLLVQLQTTFDFIGSYGSFFLSVFCDNDDDNDYLYGHMSTKEAKASIKDKLLSLIQMYILFAGREVRIGKSCSRGLEYGILKTEGTVFSNTDRPRPENNMFIFSSAEYFVSSFCVEIIFTAAIFKPGVRVRLTFRK